MKRTSNSPLSQDFVTGKPSSSSFAVSEALRSSLERGNPIKFKREKPAFDDGGIQYDCNPVALKATTRQVATKSPKGLDGFKTEVIPAGTSRVPWLQGSREQFAVGDTRTKKLRITVKDKVTGDPVQIWARIKTVTVSVCSYGTLFRFTKSNRGTSVLDSRDGKRKSAQWVESELTRILGVTEGKAKFAELMGTIEGERGPSNAEAANNRRFLGTIKGGCA